MFRRTTLTVIALALFNAGLLPAAPTRADEPPSHVLSAQDLCNLIFPGSQAMADPSKFGAVCVKQQVLPFRAGRAAPVVVAYALEPGKDPELPIGSVRVDPNDPLSDWIIADCDAPEPIDCQ